MHRREITPLKLRVSHEPSRISTHCMAEAFERLWPILERRARSAAPAARTAVPEKVRRE